MVTWSGFAGADLMGSVGVALLLGAYGLNLLGRLRREDAIYALTNAIGAGLACAASWLIAYFPFVILEGVWCVVSALALVRVLANRRTSDRP